MKAMYELRLPEQNQLLNKQEQEIREFPHEINKQSSPLYQRGEFIKPDPPSRKIIPTRIEEEVKLEDIKPTIKSEEKYKVTEETIEDMTEHKPHTRSQGPPIIQKRNHKSII